MTVPGLDTLRCSAVVLWRSLRPSTGDPLTLDLLRSSLSHETAAKLARLAALVTEWTQGEYRPEDPGDVEEILVELRGIYLRYSRRAAVSPTEFLRLVRVLVSLGRVSRLLSPVLERKALASADLRRTERELRRLRERTRLFVDGLSGRIGRRIAQVLTESVDEIRREIGGGLTPGTVAILLEDQAGPGSGWVPRADVPYWSDIFRNLVRNAVEATKEQSGPEAASLPPVVARLTPMVAAAGTTIEVHDRGLGMSPEEIDQAWIGGHGRHGPGRGQGLTESKQAFLRSRGEMTVWSRPGEGTVIRLDIPFQDVTVPGIGWKNMIPVYAPFGLALIGVLALSLGTRRPAEVERVWALTNTTIQAVDREEEPIWTRDLGESILRNDRIGDLTQSDLLNTRDALLVLRDGSGRAEAVIAATRPAVGPGHVWSIRPDNSRAEVHVVKWCAPIGDSGLEVQSTWQAALDWPGRTRPAAAVHVRAVNYSASATEFFSAEFESLGAYYHDGHLAFRLAADLDFNGRAEILLFGVNNSAGRDTTIFPRPQSVYIDCMALLEAPEVNGQSYPGTAWPDMPRAREKAYLLFPPLVEGDRPIIRRIDTVDGGPGRTAGFEVVLQDGRMYRLDERLRPIACGTGDHTNARRLAPIRPVGPLAYWSDGRRELIDLPVR